MSFHELVSIAAFPGAVLVFVVVWRLTTRGKARRCF